MFSNPMRAAIASAFFSLTLLGENWPQWRGPNLDLTSPETGLPVKWSTTENVAWKLPLPAWSGATPIVWGDHVFLSIAENGSLYLWAVDRRGPKIEWKKFLSDGDQKVRKQNMSSPSPVTDGKNVWAMTGTGALKGFDFAGNEIWSRNIQTDYGRFGLNWGYASSPLLHDDSLYVQVLHGMRTRDPSYLLRIDKKTGKTYNISFNDAKNGKFTVNEDGGSRAAFSIGGKAKVPAWIPDYPGSDPQAAGPVNANYAVALADQARAKGAALRARRN